MLKLKKPSLGKKIVDMQYAFIIAIFGKLRARYRMALVLRWV